jgi:mycofactocin precursor
VSYDIIYGVQSSRPWEKPMPEPHVPPLATDVDGLAVDTRVAEEEVVEESLVEEVSIDGMCGVY